jgi:hypothetical protein
LARSIFGRSEAIVSYNNIYSLLTDIIQVDYSYVFQNGFNQNST